VRSAAVLGENRRQLVDHGSERVGTAHRDDGNGRLAERGHGVDQLHLLPFRSGQDPGRMRTQTRFRYLDPGQAIVRRIALSSSARTS
jgi:hypothetical protein